MVPVIMRKRTGRQYSAVEYTNAMVIVRSIRADEPHDNPLNF